ncbi:MAG TPA: mannosyltransferase family protein [Acidimicrobiales bacterium]|nr:mannosyltransferase family protein [Acidimicrobiales bacterium]
MSRRAAVTDDVKAALPGWVAARVLVGVAWVVSRWWIDHRDNGVRPEVNQQGLFAWDGAFYRGIAEHGYRLESTEALRFFPLYSLAGRWLHAMLFVSPGTALLVLTNVAALGAGALIHRITRVETGDRRAARRAAWLVAIVPPAFVLSWAYAEALFIVLAAATFVALRRERWGWAAAFGFAAALTRPTGVFLALAAGVEAARNIRQRRVGELGQRVLAVVAPIVGAATYVWWVGHVFGDWKLPIRVQDSLRGGNANPITRMGEAASDLLHRQVAGLHFPFAVLFIVLAVIVWRRLPLSYGVFTLAIVVTSLAANNLNSIERYGLNAFPLVIGLALGTPTHRAERIATAVCVVGVVWMCVLAWLEVYVP